jgi:hypothetical protein
LHLPLPSPLLSAELSFSREWSEVSGGKRCPPSPQHNNYTSHLSQPLSHHGPPDSLEGGAFTLSWPSRLST